MSFWKNYLIKGKEEQIGLIFDFFAIKILNPTAFQQLKRECEADKVTKAYDLNHNANIAFDKFQQSDIIQWWLRTHIEQNGALNSIVLEKTLDVFAEIGILIKYFEPSFTANVTFGLANEYLTRLYADHQILMNKIFGFGYIADKYTSSVFKIVNIKDGHHSIGNGFLIEHKGKFKLVTNHHVISGCDEIRVFLNDDTKIPFVTESSSPNLDLAVLDIELNQKILPFKLSNGGGIANGAILDEILTIGYPPVPLSTAADPLFHMGEINSKIKTYWGRELFLFSAKTNPGNSGGPVIADDGTVVGIISEQLYEHDSYKDGKLPYYAAIPTKVIKEFIDGSSR